MPSGAGETPAGRLVLQRSSTVMRFRCGGSGCAAQADGPCAGQGAGAIRALHRAENLHRLLVLACEVIGISELQPDVIGTLASDSLPQRALHDLQALLGLAVQHQIETLVEKRLRLLCRS